MTQVISCSVDAMPCPPDAQTALSVSELVLDPHSGGQIFQYVFWNTFWLVCLAWFGGLLISMILKRAH
ncbi:hypothetical protein [Sphingomonas oryzagri]